MFTNQAPINAGITRIAVGMNYPMLDPITQKVYEKRDKTSHAEQLKSFFETYEKKKQYWKAAASAEPSLYQYLKDNIHL
jgi:hypothetical protein